MYFTDAHEELRLHIRKFLEKEVQPHLEEWEEKTFPDEIFRRFGELGFLGLRYPPEYGGQGGDYFSAVVLSEEMARAGCGGLGMAVAVQAEMATPPVFKFGTEEQKRKWVVPAIRGEQIAALAITEPDAGSDVAGITTVARRFGDEFIVNGRKIFITNGARCQWALVVTKGDRERGHSGFNLLVVEKGTKIASVQAFVYQTAQQWDRGEYPVREISQAKLLATQVACEVADDAIQILGGHGYMREFPVERAWRDARLARIGAGTDEIMKEIIAKTYGL